MNAGEMLLLNRTSAAPTETPPASNLLLLAYTAGQKKECKQRELPKSRGRT
jgi:hypothetical protein